MTFGRRRSRRPDDWPSGHARAHAALSDRLDDVLDPAEAAWLDGHLSSCPDCRQTADAYAGQRLELRALRDRTPSPPRDLWARTAAAIELEARGKSPATGRSTRRPLLAPTAFIATALVVAVASGLLNSSQRAGRDGNTGSPPVVAVATPASSAPGDVAVRPTPIPVRRSVEFVARDAFGKYHVNVKQVDAVCPEGSAKPCDTNAPVTEGSVTIDADAQAVYGSEKGERLIVISSPTTDDPGSVSVVALGADNGPGPSSEPSASPTESQTTPSDSPSASVGPSATASSEPTSSPVTPSSSPTVSATPTGSIDVTPPGGATTEIAQGVVLVGQTAAYSSSGSWFAFTARPIDGSAGPDIYVWRVGTPAAERVTDDGRSVFGSWVKDKVVGSSVVDPGSAGDAPATTGLRPESFVLDPATRTRTSLPETGSAWRPAVDPNGRKAVYWTGTLRTVDGPFYAPESGRLVLGDWSVNGQTASGSAGQTSPPGSDQPSSRHETTVAAGRMDDWDARWDESGTHLAVWIADPQNPALGRLSLYSVEGFDGAIDLKSPLLESRRAMAGFSISDGGLIWAEPSAGSTSSDGTVQLLAWTDEGVGTVQTQSGPALVIR